MSTLSCILDHITRSTSARAPAANHQLGVLFGQIGAATLSGHFCIMHGFPNSMTLLNSYFDLDDVMQAGKLYKKAMMTFHQAMMTSEYQSF